MDASPALSVWNLIISFNIPQSSNPRKAQNKKVRLCTLLRYNPRD
jgi:hypothetical protein